MKWALPARDRHGVAARALLFTTNAWVSSPMPIAFQPAEPRGLSFWFRISGWEFRHPATWPREWETGRGATLVEGMGFMVVARDNGFIGIGGDHINAGWLAPAMPTNRWQHLAISYNGTMGSFRGWLNGEALPVITNGFAFYKPARPLNAVPNIRFDGRVKVRDFNGQLDDLRVYRRALSDADAKAIWDAEKPRQPTAGEVDWDFNYHHTHVNDPLAERHVVSKKNLRRWTEEQKEPFTYWVPATHDVPGVIVYRFDFPKPTRRIFLKAQTYIVDLRAPNGPGAAHGAGAVHATRDGTHWVALTNGLEPKPQWGRMVTWEGDLPSE